MGYPVPSAARISKLQRGIKIGLVKPAIFLRSVLFSVSHAHDLVGDAASAGRLLQLKRAARYLRVLDGGDCHEKTLAVLATVTAVAATTVTAPAPAEARGIGPGLAFGLAAGAVVAGAAAASAYPYYGYYDYGPRYYYAPGPYAYYGGPYQYRPRHWRYYHDW